MCLFYACYTHQTSRGEWIDNNTSKQTLHYNRVPFTVSPTTAVLRYRRSETSLSAETSRDISRVQGHHKRHPIQIFLSTCLPLAVPLKSKHVQSSIYSVNIATAHPGWTTQFIFSKCFNKNVNNSNTNNVATQSNLSRHDVASRATPIPTFRRNITSSKRREQIIHYRRHKAQKNGILICNIYQNFITHILNAFIYLLVVIFLEQNTTATLCCVPPWRRPTALAAIFQSVYTAASMFVK